LTVYPGVCPLLSFIYKVLGARPRADCNNSN